MIYAFFAPKHDLTIPAISLVSAVFLFRFHATLDFLYVFGRRQLFGHDAAIS